MVLNGECGMWCIDGDGDGDVDGDGFLDGGDTSTWQIFRGKPTGENGGKKELELVKMAGNKKILPSENPKSKTPADGRRRRRRRRRFQ